MQCYLALNREYILANYLTRVTDKKLRRTLTKYRISEHSLAIETGRHRRSWLPVDDRLCQHCSLREVETELHFTTKCDKYREIREIYFAKFNNFCPRFNELPDDGKN